MFVVEFFPPFQCCGSLARAREQSRDRVPSFRFGGMQEVRIARFGVGLAPLFSLDQRERLTGQATRLPGFNCSADWRGRKIKRDGESHDRHNR